MKNYIDKEKNKFGFKQILIIILILIFIFSVLSAIANIYNANRQKRPFFFFSSTLNPVDGSIIYNVFPYKITEYKNLANSERYIEVSSVFKKYKNQFYDPESKRYVFEQSDYEVPKFIVGEYTALIEDVITKVNEDFFKLGTDSKYKNIYINPNLNETDKQSLEKEVNDKIKTKFKENIVEFNSLDNLKNENKVKNDKIVDGILINVRSASDK